MKKLFIFYGKVEKVERKRRGGEPGGEPSGEPGGGKEVGELQQLSILEQELEAEREKVTSLRDQLEQREMEILEHKGKQSAWAPTWHATSLHCLLGV